MLLASVIPTPMAISSIPLETWLNASPHTTIAAAVATITLLRSYLSPITKPISGPTGAEIAMMDEYSRLVVSVMPCFTSSVGPQLANPEKPTVWHTLKIIIIDVRLAYGAFQMSKNVWPEFTG